MAYCGSGNNKAIRRLLHVAVSTVVNRIAVLSICGALSGKSVQMSSCQPWFVLTVLGGGVPWFEYLYVQQAPAACLLFIFHFCRETIAFVLCRSTVGTNETLLWSTVVLLLFAVCLQNMASPTLKYINIKHNSSLNIMQWFSVFFTSWLTVNVLKLSSHTHFFFFTIDEAHDAADVESSHSYWPFLKLLVAFKGNTGWKLLT